jgi:peptide/nickel transport system substrate-binding protein
MVRVHKRRLAAVAAAGVLAGSLASCAEAGSPAHGERTAARDLVLKVATTDTVSSLDPAGAYEVGSRTLQANLYQTLLTMLPGKPTPVPDAADCQYDTPTTYTCSLKTGLTFPNGHRLTSSDVKFSFDRIVRIKAQNGPVSMFTTVASVTAPDELTVAFNLKRPDARLPYLLTTTAASIVDEEVYPAAGLLTGQAVGSGPYKLESYTAGRRAVLAKFTGYRGVRPAQNDGVEMNILRTSAELRKALTSGKADLGFRGFGPVDLDKLRADEKVQVVEADATEIRYFAFDLRSATARKPAVRRAVAQLIDRQAIAKRAYGDHVTPLYSVVPATIGGQVDVFRQEYNEPDKTAAAAILREAGITAPVTLTLGWTPSRFGSGAKLEAQELKRQLEASGLFKVNLRGVEWPRYQQLARAGAFDLYHSGWVPDYPDGDDYLSPFVKDGEMYQNGYKSQTANKLLEREIGAQNQLDREATLGELQTVLARDVPVVPTWQGRMTVVAGKDVRNVPDTLNPLYVLYYSPLGK